MTKLRETEEEPKERAARSGSAIASTVPSRWTIDAIRTTLLPQLLHTTTAIEHHVRRVAL